METCLSKSIENIFIDHFIADQNDLQLTENERDNRRKLMLSLMHQVSDVVSNHQEEVRQQAQVIYNMAKTINDLGA